jgi:hypothetical protein
MYNSIRRGVKKAGQTISPYITNFGGWTTERKIMVIESDDWGSIRMPSEEVYEKFLRAGYRVDNIAYEMYDSLASNEDLEFLFELLSSFKDFKGSHPVITANVLTANPDFEMIRNSQFREYHYELVTQTLKRYPKHDRAFKLWLEGVEKGFFFPQSHGREHLNVSMFMNALQRGDKDVLFGFGHSVPGSIPYGENFSDGNKYIEALRYTDENDKKGKLAIILEGLDLFEELFGYRSESIIAPNYIWSPDYDGPISRRGVQFYQGNRKMKEPKPHGGIKYHSYRLGDKNRFGQYYLVRNAFFEPSLFSLKIKDPVDHCLNQIKTAFRMNKPAIICSHRINYVGFLNVENRDNSLKLLKELLGKVKLYWPDVEFMTSVQLGSAIKKNDHTKNLHAEAAIEA